MSDILIKIGYALASLFLIFNYGLLLIGVTMKIIARVHGRIGPPSGSPMWTLLKAYQCERRFHMALYFILGRFFVWPAV